MYVIHLFVRLLRNLKRKNASQIPRVSAVNPQHYPRSLSEEKFKMFGKNDFLFRISDQTPLVSGFPSVLFLCYCGLIGKSNKNCSYRAAGVIFKILIISVSLTVLTSALIQYNGHSLKIVLGTVCSYVLTLAMYFTIHRKKELLTTTVNKLSRFPLLNRGVKKNLSAAILCSMPAIYSNSILLTCNWRWTARYHVYGYEVENPYAQFLMISVKTFLNALVYLTFTNLVSLVYCTLCQCCCLLIKNLTEEVLKTSPNAFGPSQKMEILRHKTKIDDVLESIQETFSLPSFFIFTTHFLTYANIIGWLLCFDLADYKPHMFTQTIFFGSNAFGCVVVTLWIVGGLPVQMKKFRDVFYKKSAPQIAHCGQYG
ncbi:uncharacterized protein TNCT_213421 [Trichonephila clavata]|uniref:Uncharacterized protein n=1 Tax=Trichonephila clavata TaxID=2740835 RepID=A0A8X6FPI3_TRICU|nr:uncharacterized protein TNCT_213421 [Trichonephila clavata]